MVRMTRWWWIKAAKAMKSHRLRIKWTIFSWVLRGRAGIWSTTVHSRSRLVIENPHRHLLKGRVRPIMINQTRTCFLLLDLANEMWWRGCTSIWGVMCTHSMKSLRGRIIRQNQARSLTICNRQLRRHRCFLTKARTRRSRCLHQVRCSANSKIV